MSSQLELQPNAADGIDTYIVNGDYGDLNLGSADIMNIGTNHFSKATVYSRALARFDLRSLPAGATVLGATLKFYLDSSASLSMPAQFAAYRLTQASWTELGATWNRYDGSHVWSVAGGDFSTADHDTTVISFAGADLVFSNLKNLAIDAIANRDGFLNLLVVGPESGTANNFLVVRASDYGSSSSRPKLVIDYDPPPYHEIPNFTGGMQQLTGNLGA